MLRVEGLGKTARRRPILEGVTFDIPLGTVATVLGPSGSGKTTLLRILMGLERADQGAVWFDGRCLASEDTHLRPQDREMSLVFQEFTLFPNLDVAENLRFGLQQRRGQEAIVDDLLELLEIAHLKRRRVEKLSGGEQQRVALARALAVRPRVLLMDEPFSNIDNMLRGRLYARLSERLRDYGMTTLIATHDHKEAFFFSDAILVLKGGRLIDHNPPREIYQRPANSWVAEFFGDANYLEGRVLTALGGDRDLQPDTRYLVRPEAFELVNGQADQANTRVVDAVYYGTYQDVTLDLDGGLSVRARFPGMRRLAAGDLLTIRLHDDLEPHALERERGADAAAVPDTADVQSGGGVP